MSVKSRNTLMVFLLPKVRVRQICVRWHLFFSHSFSSFIRPLWFSQIVQIPRAKLMVLNLAAAISCIIDDMETLQNPIDALDPKIRFQDKVSEKFRYCVRFSDHRLVSEGDSETRCHLFQAVGWKV